MAPAGQGKKRTTNAKQSAHSKRHKTSSGLKTSSKPSSIAKARASASTFSTDASIESASKARISAFPADKPLKESAKKDRKGKGPASIAIVKGHDLSDESDEDLGMEVDEELLEVGGAAFLNRLDEKGMSV